jgi:hypothetical protein
MTVPQYDIFSGSGQNDALWLECIEGLDAATERMHEIAAKQPGMYFVLNLRDRLVVAKTDTSSSKDRERSALS